VDTGRRTSPFRDHRTLHVALAEIGYTTVAKLHAGVRGADSERVVLLYRLQKP
jgi:hypothetical protein